ncbi:alpha/beta hydrolase [Micromonospora echinofusca]|uniref:Alpha/beta fold hydrolase n=1 Tax=Micromonospora echinofusca TaxID=47858 RepID=A0ABS3VXG1_MICEH|nr:alpha/beta hydrolase [Micromonospora echinofusca]MBO4209059.1 alpha/beta fold hydrolase [Micromonospora echinofusca]
MREHTVDTGGRHLRVVEDGDPAGLPVLVQHGTPGAPLFWPSWVADARSRGIRLVGFARPGYAGSTRRPGRSVADTVTDCAAVADALALDRFATWGVSGGGPHALACAAGLGDRVTAVAVLGSLGPVDAPDLVATDGMREDNVAELTAAAQGEQVLRPMLEPTATAMATVDRAELIAGLDDFLDSSDAQVARAGFAGALVDGIRDGLRAGVDGWVDDDLALARPWGFALSAVAQPVGVWHGVRDAMVPVGHGRWLADTAKADHVALSAGDGHLAVLAHRVPDVHAWLLASF